MSVAAPSVSSEGPVARADAVRPALLRIPRLTMRLTLILLIGLVAVLQYRVWVGEGSLADVHGLQQEIADQKVELERLRARNQQLRAEVMDLQSGDAALEERARGELGMIKPGEAFIQAIERPKPASTTHPRAVK
jgi:cell division protein FtsB